MNNFISELQLPFAIGPLLYTPALNDRIADKLIAQSCGPLTSLAFCLEDTILDDSLEEAQHQLVRTLRTLSDCEEHLPLLFVRIRTPEHMEEIHQLLGEYEALLCGYIAPKFDERNASAYLDLIDDWNSQGNQPIYFMPILESDVVARPDGRIERLQVIKERLDLSRRFVVNVRVGGNDLCNLYNLRRNVNQTIYDIGIVRNILVDILSVFSQDYVVSGAVWEYYGENTKQQWAVGLQAELELDRLNGFTGKTAIHPCQIPLILESLQVDVHDYLDAKRILAWKKQGSGVAGSAGKNRMNEVKTHQKWAERILLLASLYGLKDSHQAESGTAGIPVITGSRKDELYE